MTFYSDAIYSEHIEKEKMLALIKSDFAKAFTLFIQPLYQLAKGGKPTVIGGEFLLRPLDKAYSNIEKIIVTAEQSGMIIPLGSSCIDYALRQLARVDRTRYSHFSINLSALQLLDNSLIDTVSHLCATYGIPNKIITFELTETAIIEDTRALLPPLQALRDMGFKIAIDDFGKGHSSLTRLHELPVDILKLDRLFIENINEDIATQNIVQSIIELSHALNLQVVAEGIETIEQLGWLTNLQCDYAQGYFLNRPMPFADFSAISG